MTEVQALLIILNLSKDQLSSDHSELTEEQEDYYMQAVNLIEDMVVNLQGGGAL